jgi:vanillate O-demethylase ferredoxin subunit
MLDAFERLTANRSVARVHLERFVPPKLPPAPGAQPFKLVLSRSGQEIDVPADWDLARALDVLNIKVPISCGGGICGACRTRWIEGPPLHRDRVLTPTEREHEVIVCVAQCAGSRLVLDL